MLKLVQLKKLDDYFLNLGERENKGAYFYRVNGYHQEIHDFIRKYYETARLSGVIIEGRLPNPDEGNLAYYREVMGTDFQLSMGFLLTSLKKWLPRLNDMQCNHIATAIYDTLMELKQNGKNDNMLKNAYIKFMCWLYYKFERIVNHLGEEKLPKILYEGTVSSYEFLLLQVLSAAGCDILLLQYQGDKDYLQLDATSAKSLPWQQNGMQPFPASFSLKQIQKEIREDQDRARLYGEKPQFTSCTNAWLTGDIFADIQNAAIMRGNDNRFFYNCFCRINGVADKLTYQNELYQLQLTLRNEKRRMVIIDDTIPPPTVEEINNIKRGNYQNLEQLIMDLCRNLPCGENTELRRMMRKVLVDVIFAESAKGSGNLNRLTSRVVCLLCWLNRYERALFAQWHMPEVACFFHMGGCKNDNEAFFCQFLARLPVDVLILVPNLNESCCLTDELLYDVHYDTSLAIDKYPQGSAGVRVGTAAYYAERELDTALYQDSGIYRNRQYEKANAISLQTMFEEIPILWNEELKYRPNFSTVNDMVNMPVVFAKVSGVKDSALPAYWSMIKRLMTADTIVIKSVPHITSVSPNPMKSYAVEFFRNGILQKSKIKAHKAYQYGFLRESMQDYLLDKLEFLIRQKIIKGTFENGTEYTIIATALNIDKKLIRMIQKFDFTKKNPKLIYIITGETVLSLEDTIYTAFLNLVGFDIIFFVPTGYQCVERYFNGAPIEEHQIGEYFYDVQIPDFDTIPTNQRQSWRNKIFKRGN